MVYRQQMIHYLQYVQILLNDFKEKLDYLMGSPVIIVEVAAHAFVIVEAAAHALVSVTTEAVLHVLLALFNVLASIVHLATSLTLGLLSHTLSLHLFVTSSVAYGLLDTTNSLIDFGVHFDFNKIY
ncbi:hypothetical protein FB192DRAFT_1038683 [Mucor lusitanicus]|uniref:Uncharacterized protein n=1 Tax=Mucor circinelloides f. lusitanicus TaxID=29924 RepID=A0A8H4EWM2_MUCCL|nr:hypothetical protein FB192DRAFT_1038683 [Mucor lusitanicus]